MKEQAPLSVLPIKWIRAKQYCDITGEPMDTINGRILDAVWAAGVHYKRTGPRTLWINITEAQKWIDQQPHVEALCQRASKSVTVCAAAA
ncbi:MAG TPA: hypothetical protein VJ652_16505 [Noviherbaspirillum sp.]|nr:hypothetical protein [Noviherbaspirillum sp.]